MWCFPPLLRKPLCTHLLAPAVVFNHAKALLGHKGLPIADVDAMACVKRDNGRGRPFQADRRALKALGAWPHVPCACSCSSSVSPDWGAWRPRAHKAECVRYIGDLAVHLPLLLLTVRSSCHAVLPCLVQLVLHSSKHCFSGNLGGSGCRGLWRGLSPALPLLVSSIDIASKWAVLHCCTSDARILCSLLRSHMLFTSGGGAAPTHPLLLKRL